MIFFFISRYLFDNVCPILLLKSYDMMHDSLTLPCELFFVHLLTVVLGCPSCCTSSYLALLFWQFYPKHPASFHLANIHNYFSIARKGGISFVAYVLLPHTQLSTYWYRSFFYFISFYPQLLLSDPYPFYNRITVLVESGKMQ